MKTLQPEGWPPPKGFANGILADGRSLHVAGQIGNDAAGNIAADLAAQVEQALANIAAVLAAGGAKPEHVVRLTWYMLDIAEYETRLRDIGAAYRRVMGRHFPAMSVIEVRRLVEPRATVEIEGTAVVP
jgi:enamine deaminase RidA (YjgF/YER057c/UK114 family)